MSGQDVKAHIGKSGGAFIKFDSSVASSQLQISSSGFILGQSGSGTTTGAFLSGSKEGKLEISSSNFHVAANGNVSMSGNIKAAGGQIATFSITSGSIDSNASNTKRGLKLEPGESIRGYGNTVHSTTTVQGKFSFGVATVSPPVDAPESQRFSSDFGAASLPGGGTITT